MSAETSVNITIKIDDELLEKVDARIKALDLNRSQYFRRLVRIDLNERNETIELGMLNRNGNGNGHEQSDKAA